MKFYYVLREEDEQIAARDAKVDPAEVARLKAEAIARLKDYRQRAVEILAKAKQAEFERAQAVIKEKEDAFQKNLYKQNKAKKF